ncbi:four helix bundle protein [Capnocytophaga haemolytica]|mgnify:CR=1 FL=1|uniref:Four helix bundle protein n=1 Tax=Capnocytophaga haemolytica TaxID=45243 RepID=A0AAX2GZP4_9FLAO|nr:four helix bundle protein [Capnocytophaga haemolytica]AMD84085.1 four helix bundle protein [Capnocytophaga haemolytica]SFO06411.1 four helix bundle protein [Capnocytophaga haemolytica]SNV13595.1 four helix bundle protein [Capnocytophaga haemolytica]
MEKGVLKEKSFRFAIRIVNLYKYLVECKKEFVLSKQVLRSGTSVGAMVREAECAESREDFIHKLSIGYKEMNETVYWLELLFECEYISEKEYESIDVEATELIKLLASSLKTARMNKEIKSK